MVTYVYIDAAVQTHTILEVLCFEKMWLIIGLITFAALCIKLYFDRVYTYWERNKVPCSNYRYLFGHFWDTITLKKSLGQIYYEIYNEFKEYNYIGYYKFLRPGVIINNPEIIKDIIVKDFNHFHDNDFHMNENDDFIFGNNPFVLRGPKWKVVRSQLSPSFTNGKVKVMMPLLVENAEKMNKYINQMIDSSKTNIEVKDLACKFTSQNIASCAFGLDGESFTATNPKFHEIGKQLTEPTFIGGIKMVCIMGLPTIARYLKIKFFSNEVTAFLKNIVVDTLNYRKSNSIIRNDFLDFMNNLKMKINNEKQFNENDITAHAGGFFLDGYETSAIAISFALYEIASHPEAQQKLRENIDETLKKYNGELTFEAVNEMEYLDWVFKESLRKNVPLLALSKVCTQSYKLPPASVTDPGPEVTLPPGTPVIIPAYGLHMDSRYFPDPEKFIPERFSDMENITKYSYLPFGDGPRICLGMKFGTMQSKVALASIISKFTLDVNQQTAQPLEIDPRFFMRVACGGIWINFHKRQ